MFGPRMSIGWIRHERMPCRSWRDWLMATECEHLKSIDCMIGIEHWFISPLSQKRICVCHTINEIRNRMPMHYTYGQGYYEPTENAISTCITIIVIDSSMRIYWAILHSNKSIMHGRFVATGCTRTENHECRLHTYTEMTIWSMHTAGSTPEQRMYLHRKYNIVRKHHH